MNSAKYSASDQLRSKAKKLEMLASLLDDGEIASELASVFAPAATPVVAVVDPSTIQRTAPRKSTPRRRASATRRRRGALERKVIETVTTSPTPMSARAVTQRLEDAGFAFGSEAHQVAVSKALRQAAKRGKIKDQRNGHAKAAIIYTAPVALESSSIVLVQGSPN